MTALVSRATCIAGASPALAGIITSAPYARAKPSAIWLRQEFPIQTNRTRFTVSPGTAHVPVRPRSTRGGRWRPDAGLVPPGRDHPGTRLIRGRRVPLYE